MSNIVTSGFYDNLDISPGLRPAVKKSMEFYKTNEQMHAEQKQKVDQSFNDFLGITGGIDEFLQMNMEIIEAARETQKDNIMRKEDLLVNDEDPYHLKKFEAEQFVFTRDFVDKKHEEEKERIAKGESHSHSTDTVITDKPKFQQSSTSMWNKAHTLEDKDVDFQGYSSVNNQKETKSRCGIFGGKKSSVVNDVDDNRPKLDSVYDHIGRITENTQKVASKTKAWREFREPEETGWQHGKRTLWQKAKRFMRKPKFRIMSKVGMLMALQLGMAMIGKKYEFEGFGQAAAFLGMMMGVFYLTKELQNEDFDVRGFGIL